MHRRAGASEDSDDPAGDDIELLRRRQTDPKLSAEKPNMRRRICMAISVLLGAAVILGRGTLREWTESGELNLVTWNIAAINNNPFEYWITHEDADYNKLMIDVQEFISSPGTRDVPVGDVFTPAMWAELKQEMSTRGWSGLAEVEALWTSDFRKRPIISGFMKDKALGEKRLASMPDRITNTINLASGGVANRPTVINCFEGDMTSLSRSAPQQAALQQAEQKAAHHNCSHHHLSHFPCPVSVRALQLVEGMEEVYVQQAAQVAK